MKRNTRMRTYSQQVLELASQKGVLRSQDLTAHALPRVVLTRLVNQGSLIRVDRGLYRLPDKPFSEHHSLAEVSHKYPKVIICLLSALRFYELTTQSPFEVWVATPNKTRAPKMDTISLRVVWFSGIALKAGIEEKEIDDATVHITNISRTIADCFKYRNKIGLDVALEALHEAWKNKRTTMDQLWYYASMRGVCNIMRPYLESLI